MSVQPVIEQLAEQQSDDNCGRDNESNLRIFCPDHRRIVGFSALSVVGHGISVSPASVEQSWHFCGLTEGTHPDIIEVRGGAVW